MSLKEIATATDEVVLQVSTLRITVAPKLLAGTATERELLYLDTGLRNAQQDLRATRALLDPLEVEGVVIGEHPADLLNAELQARELRHSGLVLEAQVLRAREATLELLAGAARRTVFVQAGETLQGIAARELGDWRAWPKLLEANPGLQGGALTPGVQLQIPKTR